MSNPDQPAIPELQFSQDQATGAGTVHSTYGGFTKREQAAISLRVPMSGDTDLDKMILVARRLDIATAAMQAHLRIDEEGTSYENLAEFSFNMTDILIKEAGLI